MVNLESIWSQSGVNLESIWSQYEYDSRLKKSPAEKDSQRHGY